MFDCHFFGLVAWMASLRKGCLDSNSMERLMDDILIIRRSLDRNSFVRLIKE